MAGDKWIGVTGGAGFIGVNLVEHLLKKGYNVRALVHYNSVGRLDHLERLASNPPPSLQVVRGDIRDGSLMREFVDGLDCCFHLAALIGVPYSFTAPVSYHQTNTEGTLNLLEAIRFNPGARFVFASTSEVFGNNPKMPIDESARLLPASPYAASKAAAERFVYAYNKTYPEFEGIIVRPFNTFGPRQSTRAVIPTIISQALVGNQIKLGDPSTRRDFTYVMDLAEFYEKLIDFDLTKLEDRVINCGTGEDHAIRDVVTTVGEILGKDLEIVHDETRMRPVNAEVHKLLCDMSVARKLVGWNPTQGFKGGLAETVQWLRENPENPNEYRV